MAGNGSSGGNNRAQPTASAQSIGLAGSTGENVQAEPTRRPKAPAFGVIAKVGEEYIYNVDLNTEVAAYPASDEPGQRDAIFERMVDDSIILQGAAKEKFIKLDATVYNSPEKDYDKRIALVQEARKKILDNADSYSGSVVALWFLNQKPGKIGYEQGKRIAQQKISDLQRRVKAGELTMEQAGDELRNDASLFQVDEAYKVNAYYTFTANKSKPATYDPVFETVLQKLRVNQVSDVFLGQSTDERDGKKKDAVYKFARIDKIIANRGYIDVESWLEKNRPGYALIRY